MYQSLFQGKKPVIGMVHLKALPGSPGSRESLEEILSMALSDAKALYEGGIDGIQIENQFDRPYLKEKEIGIETTAFLTAAGCAIRQKYPDVPLGINIHLNGGLQAMAAARACGADWVRVFNLASGYISNSGYIDAIGPELLRYRRNLHAANIMLFGDFQVKHGSHAITADRTLEEKARDIEDCMADAVIITGDATGRAPDVQSIRKVKRSVSVPLLLGSGINIKNAGELWPEADGAVIGSGFKEGADLKAPVNKALVEQFMKSISSAPEVI